MQFFVGMSIDINEEAVGIVTAIEGDRIHIASEVFTGWALKREIEEAATRFAKAEQSPDTPPLSPASAA